MFRILRLRKSVAFFFLFSYLLVGTGTGHALIWCQESPDFSHLELNLAGRCLSICLGEARGGEGLWPDHPVLQADEDDCRDIRATFDHAFSNAPAKQLPAAETVPPVLPPVPNHHALQSIARRLSVPRPPPPLQSLNVLRTTVLRN